MKVAVVGSRGLKVKNLELYLPAETTEIVSGGAKEIDSCAAAYARETGIPLKEFLPDYEKYGRRAPLERNLEIIEYSDQVLIFWDGKSRGSYHVLKECRERGKKYRVFVPVSLPELDEEEWE